MADKNRNGIPDEYERPGSLGPGGKTGVASRSGAGTIPRGSSGGISSAGNPARPGSLGPGGKSGVAGIFGGGTLPGGGGRTHRTAGSGRDPMGGGKMAGPAFQRAQPTMEDTPLPSFLSNLMEALGMVEGGGGVDYDPLRNDARNRGTEYDSRLAAMYNQLQNEMRNDGAGIQENYQGAIDQNAARSAQTQESVQGASDAAAQRNLQQLQALGIGEAAGNIVQEGRDLNTDTSRAVQDVAARGQIAGDNLAQNQQSAQTHNTNLVGAAGLEGNLQRARVQSELSTLLAQYDMEEQQAQQQAQQSALSQAMSMAGALTDDQWKTRGYQDDLSQMQYEQQQAQLGANQPNKLSESMAFLQSLMGSPQFADQDIEALLPYIQALGGIGKLV